MRTSSIETWALFTPRLQGSFPQVAAQRIKDTRRALILGSAGIGKTTFLRRTALNIVAGKGRSAQFLEGEYLIPFYVPLKALDLGERSPILRYLRSNYPLLSGRSGLRRLTRLAREKKILLLLDGYDEIPFPMMDGDEHPIRAELNLLMQPSPGLNSRQKLSTGVCLSTSSFGAVGFG